jgi:serine/threonine-protein kinase
LPPAIVLSVGKQLLRALEVAHEEGIIHRDIKPDNVLVQPDGVVKVMDFGIARRMEGSDGLTRANMVVGTPAYMAPEQLMGEALDARADLYSAGCVLYQCAVGRAPVELTREGSLMRMLFAEPPGPPHVQVPGFPETLSAVIMRLMARERAERPASAGAAVGLLEAVEG